jgi:hypothetical protein
VTAVEALRRADNDDFPPLPLVPAPPPLTLDEVRARVAAFADAGSRGVWVVVCRRRYETAIDLIGVYIDPADALRDIDDEIATERLEHPAAAIDAEEMHETVWEITVATVILRLEWTTVIKPRPLG